MSLSGDRRADRPRALDQAIHSPFLEITFAALDRPLIRELADAGEREGAGEWWGGPFWKRATLNLITHADGR